jgi:hypothetical protein
VLERKEKKEGDERDGKGRRVNGKRNGDREFEIK